VAHSSQHIMPHLQTSPIV